MYPAIVAEIRTSIDIDATPETVWATLTDTGSYPEWNPHLIAMEGRLAEGERVSLTLHQSGRENTLDVTVTTVQEPRRLAWVGRVGGRWLCEGRHTFELEPLDGGKRTRLHNTESSRGLLVPLAVKSDAVESYEAMNEALKLRVEGGVEAVRRAIVRAA